MVAKDNKGRRETTWASETQQDLQLDGGAATKAKFVTQFYELLTILLIGLGSNSAPLGEAPRLSRAQVLGRAESSQTDRASLAS